MKYWYLLPLVTLLSLAACGNDTTAPGAHNWTLSGRVVDAQGDPIPGAFVNIGYTVLADGDTVWTPASPAATAPFTPAVLDSFSLNIFDRRGRLIWQAGGGGDFQGYWPGTDLDGTPVPDGPYRYVLTTYTVGDSQVYERWLVVARDISGRARVADVITDSLGRFAVPASYFPIWDTYSTPTGTITFGTGIVLYAFRGDGSPTYDRMSLDLSDPPGFEPVLQISD